MYVLTCPGLHKLTCITLGVVACCIGFMGQAFNEIEGTELCFLIISIVCIGVSVLSLTLASCKNDWKGWIKNVDAVVHILAGLAILIGAALYLNDVMKLDNVDLSSNASDKQKTFELARHVADNLEDYDKKSNKFAAIGIQFFNCLVYCGCACCLLLCSG